MSKHKSNAIKRQDELLAIWNASPSFEVICWKCIRVRNFGIMCSTGSMLGKWDKICTISTFLHPLYIAIIVQSLLQWFFSLSARVWTQRIAYSIVAIRNSISVWRIIFCSNRRCAQYHHQRWESFVHRPAAMFSYDATSTCLRCATWM